jgi:hypothetical protein
MHSAIQPTRTPSHIGDKSTAEHQIERPLTIAEAKAALALKFGVNPDNVEITIRG